VPRWADLAAEAPALADAGRALIYQFGVGLGYLATVRHDGGPRIHPVCPIVANDSLYVFLIPSPKRADLLRDPRYALHTNGPEKTDDEFYVTGQARRVTDTRVRAVVAAAYHVPVPDDLEPSSSRLITRCTRSTRGTETGRQSIRAGQGRAGAGSRPPKVL
jgi:pyridoxamine 5'-phosphate oxidase-like protein